MAGLVDPGRFDLVWVTLRNCVHPTLRRLVGRVSALRLTASENPDQEAWGLLGMRFLNHCHKICCSWRVRMTSPPALRPPCPVPRLVATCLAFGPARSLIRDLTFPRPLPGSVCMLAMRDLGLRSGETRRGLSRTAIVRFVLSRAMIPTRGIFQAPLQLEATERRFL